MSDRDPARRGSGGLSAQGLALAGDGRAPMRRDSLFRISSTSKPITAAATMAITGEGLLDLDESVDRLLAELANRRVPRHMDGPLDDTVPANRPVSVRDLHPVLSPDALAQMTRAQLTPAQIPCGGLAPDFFDQMS